MNSVTLHGVRPWRWFAAWLLVGALWAFGLIAIASVGPLAMPIALAATVVVALASGGLGLVGVLSGLGLPVLYVAYLNRAGPGNVCTSNTSGQTCVQEWSPWPWLSLAIVLVGVGAGLFLIRYRPD
ncbi:MAG TPA: hypothetical protein VFZ97_13235 [Acidimicrobiales bacterium]